MSITILFRKIDLSAVAVMLMVAVLLSGRICFSEELHDEVSGLSTEPVDSDVPPVPSPAFRIDPVSRLIYRGFSYDSSMDGSRYCIEHSEGRCLDSDYNSFASMEGQALFYDRLFLYYEAGLEGKDRFSFRKAYVKLRTGTVSWEFGKDTAWIGNGYHGSLLLSNNAEGFTIIRMRTEEPFRLPWFLSHMGDFSYDIFHGSLDDFNILAQRLVYRPVSLIEFGLSQTAIYEKGRNFKWYEYPRVLFSSEENSGDRSNRFDNDQRASMDFVLHMPFLSGFTPFKDGKVYFEYGGEDAVAWWQREDRKWKWPFGFALTIPARLYGLHLATEHFDYRVEYALNSPNVPVVYGEKGWYTKIPYTYKGVSVGHHMGPYASDLFLETGYHAGRFSCKIFYDREKHGVGIINGSVEKRDQVGLMPSYSWDRYTVSGFFMKNWYTNVDFDPDPLVFDIRSGTSKQETVLGLNIVVEF